MNPLFLVSVRAFQRRSLQRRTRETLDRRTTIDEWPASLREFIGESSPPRVIHVDFAAAQRPLPPGA